MALARAFEFNEEEEHILRALPALLKKDVWFKREVEIILSEIFSKKDELGRMLEESRISREEANRRFEALERERNELIQEMRRENELRRQEINGVDVKVDALDTKVDAQGQAIKELDTKVDHLDTKVDAQGQAIKELDTKVDHLDTKVDAQGQAIKELDTKVDHLDTKVDAQGQAIKELDTKVDHLDTKVDAQGQAIKELDTKVDHLDAKVDALDTKVDHLDTKVDALDTKVDAQGQEIKELDAKVDNQGQAITKLETSVENLGQAVTGLGIRVDRVEIKIDTLGARWGIFAESTIRNTLRELLLKHLDAEEIVEWRVHDKDGIVFGYPQDVQIDFLVKNGEEYLGEIKSSAGSADVTVLSRKAKFYTQITGKSPKILLVAVSINEEGRKSCERLNIRLITHDELQ